MRRGRNGNDRRRKLERKPERKPDRGQLRIDEQECKGCGLCIEACPPKVIGMSERLNHYGYHPAVYAGAGCTGCGICFIVCPEPGAITVFRLVSAHEVEAARQRPPRRERAHAQATDQGQRSHREGAVLAGCRAFYGYPITPASEIAEAAAVYLPQAGGVFVQAESEVAAINMLYGARVGGRARHDRLERPRHQPDAGRHQLPGRRGTALRDRRHHARRSGAGQHRARAGRLQPGREGRRPRQLPHHRAGAGTPCRRWPI